MENLKLEWNVYVYDINRRKVKVYNIFNHGRFYDEVIEMLKKEETIDEFKKRLETSLMYYFWSKSEWEILVSPWLGDKNDKEIKIDVYDQVMNNWEIFSNYVWSYHLD